MEQSSNRNAHEEVVQTYRLFLQALVNGDTDAFDRLLDDDFALTHITGDVQPKNEWLSQIQAGQFVYHQITEKDLTAEVDGDTAQVVGPFIMDATIHGSRGAGSLLLTMDYTRRSDTWSALRAVGAAEPGTASA